MPIFVRILALPRQVVCRWRCFVAGRPAVKLSIGTIDQAGDLALFAAAVKAKDCFLFYEVFTAAVFTEVAQSAVISRRWRGDLLRCFNLLGEADKYAGDFLAVFVGFGFCLSDECAGVSQEL